MKRHRHKSKHFTLIVMDGISTYITRGLSVVSTKIIMKTGVAEMKGVGVE